MSESHTNKNIMLRKVHRSNTMIDKLGERKLKHFRISSLPKLKLDSVR